MTYTPTQVIVIGAMLLGLTGHHADPVWSQLSEPPFSGQTIRVDIAINARQFKPSPVSVPVGTPILLRFHNQDVELHAFVPIRFLEGVPVHVDGNGAPQFGAQGLERVLIPSGGTEEIRVTLPRAGEFDYRCDLPGHQMVGKIVVMEQAKEPQSASERNNGSQRNP